MPGIKDRAYVTNLNYKKDKGTQWVSFFIDMAVSCHSFGNEYIPQ